MARFYFDPPIGAPDHVGTAATPIVRGDQAPPASLFIAASAALGLYLGSLIALLTHGV